MREPNARQRAVLDFLRDRIRRRGDAPSSADLARHLRIGLPSARRLLSGMESAGLLRLVPAGAGRPAAEASLARMARGIVLLAFRNGPLEDLHAGVPCPCCHGKSGFSRITDAEMKLLMTTAVDRVFTLLALEALEPGKLEGMLAFADLATKSWDRPELTRDF